MIKKILILLALTLTSANINAQSAGINFTLGFPMGEFKDNLDRLGYGISGHFALWNPKPQMPFTFGLNIGYLNYGSESRREPFSLTIPDVTVDVDRTNNLVNFHLLFQVMLPEGPFRPYAEFLFGGAYLFTETSIHSRGDGDDVASSTNFDDFAWNYGAGGGFLIQVSEGNDEEVGGVFIDLKARYLFGSEAEYLKEGSVRVQNGRVIYDVTKSKTDLLTAHLGVIVFFNHL
ncbi:MAG: hypothetical protein IPM56_00360 [Ignavibacteriales bacterium]|nr:MAG: hypothetical protein IPM56_00360 [Ignavibacteriales bacterium]